MKDLRKPQDFRDELTRVGADAMVNYYLLEGVPAFFDTRWDEYCDFKREIAEAFGLHPKTVMVVGSGRLGFSTSPKKLWQLFDAGPKRSDLDVVVAAPDLFDRAWRELCEHEMTEVPRGAALGHLQRRRNMLYEGRLDPKTFPKDMDFLKDWLRFFGDLSSKTYGGGAPRTINAWLFRDWRFVQRYYRQAFQAIIDAPEPASPGV